MSTINGWPTRIWIKLLRLSRDPITGCEEWAGARNSDGYGQIRIDGKSFGAHRVSYEVLVSPIPDGLYVLHACDNPPCVRPDHLWLGTPKENMQDAIRKGRMGVRRFTTPTSPNPPSVQNASQVTAGSEISRKSRER